jgi:23S rRNA (guanosine2251-2'-O)-methyltransferase
MSAARVLAGFHAVTARLRAAPHSVESIRFDARRRDGRMQQLRELAGASGVPMVPANGSCANSAPVPPSGRRCSGRAIERAVTLDDVLADVRRRLCCSSSTR